MHIVDTHCHLDLLDYHKVHEDVAQVVRKAVGRNVKTILHVALTVEEYYKVELEYRKFPEIYFAVGVHPSNAHRATLDLDKLRAACADERVVAVGEIGLDSYHTTEHMDIQYEYFRKQLQVAKELDLPVIIHVRGDVVSQCLDMIEESGVRKGVVHCYTDTMANALRAIELGFHIGVGGIATFKNAEEIRDIIRAIPLERILTETDAPYLAPVPFRGKPNEPAYTADVVNYVAAVKGLTPEEFAAATTANARALFKFPGRDFSV